MDTWKFYDITHRDHVICNPTSLQSIEEIVRLVELPDQPRVLDVACGKGEFLLRLAERYGGERGDGFRGVGVDISPYHIAELREAARKRVPAADLELLEMDGADYRPEPGTFDLASCIGASWVFGGHRNTLRALREAARPAGLVLVGEPFWRSEPDPAYLAWSGRRRDEFGSHVDNVDAGVDEGLVPLLAFVSEGTAWDRYETLQWRAAARWATAHPDDPDLPELLGRVDRSRHAYLTWGRDTLGWALYLFACPGPFGWELNRSSHRRHPAGGDSWRQHRLPQLPVHRSRCRRLRRRLGSQRRAAGHLLRQHVVQRRLATTDHVRHELAHRHVLLALAPVPAPREQDPDARALGRILERERRDGLEAVGHGRAVGHVVGRPPVEDLLDQDVLAVHAVVRRPDPAPRRGRQLVHAGRRRPASCGRMRGSVMNDQTMSRGAGWIDSKTYPASRSVTMTRRRSQLGGPRRPEVVDPAGHLAQVVVRLAYSASSRARRGRRPSRRCTRALNRA